ncbi:MAG: phosphoribosyltransferase family protein [Deltaproteobacteria bacterium]|jgi:hypothetical protein|nr:phosphoribosyltransferase family protein [Deltaproteobacteria bacterium]
MYPSSTAETAAAVEPTVEPVVRPCGGPPEAGCPAGAFDVQLASGRLRLRLARADRPLSELCGFASRLNARRGFLFVSKVLGKHWPVKPSAMARTHRELAAKLLALAPRAPLALAAMAETSVGLGRGTFEAWTELAGVSDALFLQTTRLKLARPLMAVVEEPHCHAPRHWIYRPASAAAERLLAGARTLALVDDEITTGRTLANLAKALVLVAPRVERLILASLLDWLGPERKAALAAELPRPADFVSLLEGEFAFEPVSEASSAAGTEAGARSGGQADFEAAVEASSKSSSAANPASPLSETPVFKSVGGVRAVDDLLSADFGRLGLLAGRRTVEPAALAALAEGLRLPPGAPALVLGAGEFLHEPYLLARMLENQGRDVLFQSTTRTPIALGGDVRRALRFEDEFGEGLDNFLYNVEPDSGRTAVACYPVKALPSGHDLPARLRARKVFF